MTVATSTIETTYDGNDSTTEFATVFAYLTDANVIVTLTTDGIDDIQVLGTDYTLEKLTPGVGASAGVVTMTTAPATGTTLTIQRVVDYAQATSFRTQGSFSTQLHEQALDKAMMLAQQLRANLTDELTDGISALRTEFESDPNAAVIDARTVQSTGSTTARSLAERFSEVRNVKDFGAVGNGITDDASAIRAGLAALEADGGGTLMFPAGTYLLNSFGATYGVPGEVLDFVAELTSNIHLVGTPGAKLKVADGLIDSGTGDWKGNLFMAVDQDNVSIEDLEIDFNGANNLATMAPWHVYGLFCVNTSNIVVRRCVWYDIPGFNYVVTYGTTADPYTPSATGLVVEDCDFRNGGTSIVGNTLQTDFSAVYSTNFATHISRNRIHHDVRPWTYSGGIELHASDSQAIENIIEDSYPALYLGRTPSTLERIKVQNNILKNCHSGIVIPGGFSTSGDYNQIDIVGNTVTLLRFATLGTGFHSDGLIQTTPINTPGNDWTDYPYTIKNLNVQGNSFESLNGIEADQFTDGISLASLFGANFLGNCFKNLSGAPFRFIGSPYSAKHVRIADNICIDYGHHNHVTNPRLAIGMLLSGSSATPPVAAYAADDFVVENNAFILTTSPAGSSVAYTDFDAGTTLTQWVCHNNQAIGQSILSNGTNISDTPVTSAYALSSNATIKGNLSGSTAYASDLQPYQVRSLTNDHAANLTKSGGQTAAINYQTASRWIITATGTTLTIGAPSNGVDGAALEITIINNAGAGLTTTFDSSIKLAGGSWTDPADGKERTLKVRYKSGDGFWHEMFRSSDEAA